MIVSTSLFQYLSHTVTFSTQIINMFSHISTANFPSLIAPKRHKNNYLKSPSVTESGNPGTFTTISSRRMADDLKYLTSRQHPKFMVLQEKYVDIFQHDVMTI